MLWFKNLMLYRLNRDLSLQAETLESQLAALAFTPCASQDRAKIGWVAPVQTKENALVHAAGGQLLICARKEEKILPAPVLRQALEDRITKLEATQHRKLKKVEKDALKEDVLHVLLPRAFSRFNQTWLWIDTQRSLIALDCASTKKAEEILALLRKSLGSLPVVPLTPERPVEMTLTEWVRGDSAPLDFQLLDEAELKSTGDEGGLIRCKNQPLICDEIAAHIEAGKWVTRLALDWQQRVQFLLTHEGALKRLKFTQTLREQNNDMGNDDPVGRFDADFSLMIGELTALLESLIAGLGGEAPR